MTTTNTTVQTILAQIGKGALFMLGAKNFVSDGDAVSFRIRGSQAANYVKITLDPSDTYSVEFRKIRGNNFPVVAERLMIYADGLNQVIESVTKLRTSL